MVDTNREEVVLELSDAGTRIDTWSHYQVNSSFLTPCDGFQFTVSDHLLSKDQQAALVPGASVKLSVDGHQQVSGFIDEVSVTATRNGGVEYQISGRDRLGQVVDSGADLKWQFKDTQSLEDVIRTVFGAFGFTKFVVDNDGARSVRQGQTRGTPTSKKGKPLKSYQLYKLRPHDQEGAMAFATRIAQRYGLRIWLSPDGDTVIVSTPDYEQAPAYSLARTARGVETNIVSASVKRNMSEQPSIVVADGFSGGGEFGRSKIRAYAINPTVDVDNSAVVANHPTARRVDIKLPGALPAKMRAPRPLFLHDEESKTQEQLENFVRREMAQRLRASLEVHMVVDGHRAPNGAYWATDTMVTLRDDLSGLNEALWIVARTFQKSRHDGTTTELQLIRPYSLVF